jgi:hypothetical protein
LEKEGLLIGPRRDIFLLQKEFAQFWNRGMTRRSELFLKSNAFFDLFGRSDTLIDKKIVGKLIPRGGRVAHSKENYIPTMGKRREDYFSFCF